MIKLNQKNILLVFTLLRVDVFFILFTISANIGNLSLDQLIEDKICLNQLKLNQSICLKIENVDKSLEVDKNYVLTRAANYKNYQNLLLILPGIFLNLFVGCSLDLYPEYTKFICAIPALGVALDASLTIVNCLIFQADYKYLLIASVFRGFTGNLAIVLTSLYTYVSRKTEAKYLAIRFATLAFFATISFPISTYFSGLVLTSKPWIAGQPRNYIGVHIISAVLSLMAVVWILLLLNDAEGPVDKDRNDKSKGRRNSKLNNLNEMTSESKVKVKTKA